MYTNLIVIQGRLGRDADSGETNGGTPRVKFSLANSRRWTQDGERKEQTTWVPVQYYGKSAAAVAPYLTKGKHVTVVGRLNTYEFEGDDGKLRKGFEIVANEVQLGAKSEGGGSSRDDDDDAVPASKPKAKAAAKSRASDGDDENPPW